MLHFMQFTGMYLFMAVHFIVLVVSARVTLLIRFLFSKLILLAYKHSEFEFKSMFW